MAPLFLYRVEVQFTCLEDKVMYVGHLDLEVITGREAYGLAVSALASRYPNLDTIAKLRVVSGPIDSYEPEERQFEIGELVLAANHVNNMIDPLPAYSAWELREVADNLQAPYLWADKEEEILFIAMVPYGIRKVRFSITPE